MECIDKITEEQFKAAAETLLPKYIMISTYTSSGTPKEWPYRLDANMLLGGGFRISYWNYYLEADVRKAFDEQWDDPLDCIKVMLHTISQTVGCYKITEQEFEAKTLPFNKNAGLKEVAS
jgi:hypothetical protein